MGPGLRKWLRFALKLAIAAGIIYAIFRKILQRQHADALWAQLADLSYPLVAMCAVSFGIAIFANVLRWDRLLRGQGIHAPKRYLTSTFMIARFFSAVGGLIGLSGFRLYDIAKRTGKTARAAASIGIEMVIGNMAMGLIALISCAWGMRYVGAAGVAMLCALFGSVIAVGFFILWKPALVRLIAQRLPQGIARRLQTAVDAVCAYEGKGVLLAETVGLGLVVHLCNNTVYVFSAKALGVDLPIAELFFVSTLQNIVSHLPITPNGVGLREMTAVGLYAAVGLPPEQAVLIPIVGFAVDMAVSSIGGLLLLARRHDYAPNITVEDADRENQVSAQIERVPESEWPRIQRGAVLGLGAGVVAGVAVGLAEGWAIHSAAHGHAEPDVWFYGTLSYALLCGMGGLVGGAALAWSGRLMQRRAVSEPAAFGHLAGGMAAAMTLVIGAFRIKRDVFQEELQWKSGQGLLVLLGVMAAAALVYVAFFLTLRALTKRAAGGRLRSPAGSLGFAAACVTASLAYAALSGASEDGSIEPKTAKAPPQGGNVLFIVVDTLRADHLPAYGYQHGKTPHLDALARDAVRFEHAYANASWTRPSFATLLTGRYASSHGVMSKASSLPDQAETLAEVFSAAGYTTGGIVTNYNVAPFFNFQQGFDRYRYLAPDFLFGASDTAAKLSLLQVVRRVDEKINAALDINRPGSAYQDAPTVNREVWRFLDQQQGQTPWFLFVGYMDPHDPYYAHPYDGVGYSRAAHITPPPEEAPRLRALYDGEITFWDEHLGKLVAALKQRKLYDDLTIVITSDHGEEFMDHGGFWHGTTLYDEQLHVPLFVKLPGNARAGSSVAHWVELVDVMPSLLALHKLRPPAAAQGVDVFRGKDQTFAEESHDGNVLKSLRLREGRAAFKVIVANPDNPRGVRPKELYRVDVDPREMHDLAKTSPAALSHSEDNLEQVTEQVRTGALKAREVDLAMDETAQERLKALGYAGE